MQTERPPQPSLASSGLRHGWKLLVWITFFALAGSARGQNDSSDILLNQFIANPGLKRLRQDGTVVWSASGGTGAYWEGCSLTPQGHTVTTRRSPQPGVDVFDWNGVEIGNFATPEVTLPGDVSVFSDGVLAVDDQYGGVKLYTEAGSYLSTMVAPGQTGPFGSYVDRHDQLFACDLGRQILKWDRSGQLLLTIQLSYQPGDLVVASDQTLWVTDRNGNKVRHLDPAGTPLGEFPVLGIGNFCGIALGSDGTLFVTSDLSLQIYHYSTAGVLLGSIPIPYHIPNQSGSPLFLTMAGCGGDSTTYCTAKLNSIGCTPSIASTGQASASASAGFSVRASNVRNQKVGLLMYGVTSRNYAPFQGGFLCVLPPVRRSPPTNSGGTPIPASDCSGVYTIDMNAFAHGLLGGNPLAALKTAGTVVDCQWWGRDAGFPFPNNTTLSNGLEYLVCP
ncbi:MAG: hypothetical protein ABI054_12100 [Planctomycetota bacterium]